MTPTQLKSELITGLMLVICYILWTVCVFVIAPVSSFAAIALLIPVMALHSSLQHEALHGHPTPFGWLNALLVFPSLSLVIPYLRFRDTHLAHHQDALLTDPYDDPESNYLDPAVWHRLPGWMKVLMQFNNTLLGRMVIGPAIGQISFMRSDWLAIRAGDKRVLAGWVLHIPAVIMIVWLVSLSSLGWGYAIACYLALAVLKIRTFLEHRAHENQNGRTVIVEDRGLLALLFLNNNYHVVHHMHPGVPWRELPGLYARDKDRYQRRNFGYVYRNYAEIFRVHFLRRKDPVPHPLWPDNE